MTRRYVDNPSNRRLGRVGLCHGEAVNSKNPSSRGSGGGSIPHNYGPGRTSQQSVRTYVNNAINRKLGRVGQPYKNTSHSSAAAATAAPSERGKVYVDNDFNRRVGRAGKPLGSCPISQKSPKTKQLQKAYYQYVNDLGDDEDDEGDYTNAEAVERVMEMRNRKKEVERYWEETQMEPKTDPKLIQKLQEKDRVIKYEEIEMGKKIGSGGFGEVFFAKFKDSVVAVKKLRVQKISAKLLDAFTQEIKVLCELDHPNIVHFIGACVVSPNLAMIMEYMEITVYEALHVKEIDFSSEEKADMMLQMAQGLAYLHKKSVAHCDIKPQNVLLEYSKEKEILIAKLADFGLALMKSNAKTSSTNSGETRRGFGTPRYSAPEVLNGDLLDRRGLKKADIYSISLVFYEVVCQEEPFADLNADQLRDKVGKKGLKLEFPEKLAPDEMLLGIMDACWSREPEDRPSAAELVLFFMENSFKTRVEAVTQNQPTTDSSWCSIM